MTDSTRDESSHAAHAWRAIRALMYEVHDSRGEVAEKLGMSFIRAKALIQLAAGPLTMRELVARLATDPPYTSVVVHDLEQRGLVTCTGHPDDRRMKLVTITAAGAECASIAREIQNRPPAVFDRLSAADARTLDRIVTGLLTASES